MTEHLAVWNAVAPGVFALLGLVIGGILSHWKDTRAYERSRRADRYDAIQQLYADVLANFERAIRYTTTRQDYTDLAPDLARVNARLLIMAPSGITEKSEEVGDLLFEWSNEYRQGAPKRMGETGLATISSHDKPHRERAEALYPNLNDQIVDLSRKMRKHLDELESEK